MMSKNTSKSLMGVPDEILTHCLEFLPPKSCLAVTSLHRRLYSTALELIKRNSLEDSSFLQEAVECNHTAGCRAALAGGAAAWLYCPSPPLPCSQNDEKKTGTCNSSMCEQKKGNYQTPLERATQRGHTAIVDLLLPYYRNDTHTECVEKQIVFYKALYAALCNGHFEICQLLVNNTTTNNEATATSTTATTTSSGFDINYIPALYQRASHLITAIEHKKNPETLVALLLNAGAEANKIHINGLHSTTLFQQPYLAPSSALLSAVQCQRSVECIELLLQHGAAVDAASLNGERLLSAAASVKDNHAVLKVLLECSYATNGIEVHCKGVEIATTAAVAHGLDDTAAFLYQLQIKLENEKECERECIGSAEEEEEDITVYED